VRHAHPVHADKMHTLNHSRHRQHRADIAQQQSPLREVVHDIVPAAVRCVLRTSDEQQHLQASVMKVGDNAAEAIERLRPEARGVGDECGHVQHDTRGAVVAGTRQHVASTCRSHRRCCERVP